MNLQNAIKLKEQLSNLEGEFDYGSYGYNNGQGFVISAPAVLAEDKCNTSGCVAGWCMLLNRKHLNEMHMNHSPGFARLWLDLSDEEAEFLFFPNREYSKILGYIGEEHDRYKDYTLENAKERLDFLIQKHTPAKDC